MKLAEPRANLIFARGVSGAYVRRANGLMISSYSNVNVQILGLHFFIVNAIAIPVCERGPKILFSASADIRNDQERIKRGSAPVTLPRHVNINVTAHTGEYECYA